MKNKQIRIALEGSLSGLHFSPMQKDALFKIALNGHKPRRKIKTVLILSLVLILLAAVALAAANWNTLIENIFITEHQQGPFDTWTLAQRQSLMKELEASGLDISDAPDLQGMTDVQASRLLEEYLNNRFPSEMAGLYYGVMESLKGLFDLWSFEDKAWFSTLQIRCGLLGNGDKQYRLPGEDKTNEVLRHTNAYLKEQCNLDPNAYTPYVFYYSRYPEPYPTYWSVIYRDADLAYLYEIQINNSMDPQSMKFLVRTPTQAEKDAQIAQDTNETLEHFHERQELEEAQGLMITWPLAMQAEYGFGIYGIPDENAVTYAQAIDIAKAALIQSGISPDALDELYAYGFYLVNDPGIPYYAISFFYDEKAQKVTPYCVEVNSDGTVKAVYSGWGNG